MYLPDRLLFIRAVLIFLSERAVHAPCVQNWRHCRVEFMLDMSESPVPALEDFLGASN